MARVKKRSAGGGWSRRFDVPIILPDGRRIETLADARAHLLTIPQSEHTEAFAAAVEAILMAAEGRGPMMHANVGIGRVVHGPRPPPQATAPRKKPAKKYRIVR